MSIFIDVSILIFSLPVQIRGLASIDCCIALFLCLSILSVAMIEELFYRAYSIQNDNSNIRYVTTHWSTSILEPTCAIFKVGSNVSLSVCPSVCLSVRLDLTKIYRLDNNSYPRKYYSCALLEIPTLRLSPWNRSLLWQIELIANIKLHFIWVNFA